MELVWPKECAGFDSASIPNWSHAGSNLCLDFHGDPLTAKRVVFSDGNHHMALEESLQRFADLHPDCGEIFYVTTPPGPIVTMLQAKQLLLGNLKLSIKPHLFISPPHVLAQLIEQDLLSSQQPFMQNQGNVLLVAKGNPKKINGVRELLQKDLRVFISNPEHEKVSYQAYLETLVNLGVQDITKINFIYGERIHHREAPQMIADGRADVAIVFYHLALRYTRIFPELFEIIPLGGTSEEPVPEAGNVISHTAMALVKGEEAKGQALLEFMQSETVTGIYEKHGLQRHN